MENYNRNLWKHTLEHRKKRRKLGERITLTRIEVKDDTIHGMLCVYDSNGNASYFNTIENKDKKIKEGTYDLYNSYSPKFDKYLWSLLVNDRSGIRIHSANAGKELKGCIAVGLYKYGNYIAQSRDAIKILDKVLNVNKEYKITIK